VYFVVTVISTIYFGWHYILDDIAGLTIGLLSVWIGGRTTGHPMRKQRYLDDAGDGVLGVFPPRSVPPESEPTPASAPRTNGGDEAVGDDASNGSRKDTAPA
jgi:PAP2 superfamily